MFREFPFPGNENTPGNCQPQAKLKIGGNFENWGKMKIGGKFENQ